MPRNITIASDLVWCLWCTALGDSVLMPHAWCQSVQYHVSHESNIHCYTFLGSNYHEMNKVSRKFIRQRLHTSWTPTHADQVNSIPTYSILNIQSSMDIEKTHCNFQSFLINVFFNACTSTSSFPPARGTSPRGDQQQQRAPPSSGAQAKRHRRPVTEVGGIFRVFWTHVEESCWKTCLNMIMKIWWIIIS